MTLFTVAFSSSPEIVQALSITDPQSIRDIVLHKVLIPIEPILVRISCNRSLLLGDGNHPILQLFADIFCVCAFHQPTLAFLCSSHIPMVFQSLLTQLQYEYRTKIIFGHMSSYIRYWKENGAETVGRGKVVLRTLEQEGIGDTLEQTRLNSRYSADAAYARKYSFEIMINLGMNPPQPPL